MAQASCHVGRTMVVEWTMVKESLQTYSSNGHECKGKEIVETFKHTLFSIVQTASVLLINSSLLLSSNSASRSSSSSLSSSSTSGSSSLSSSSSIAYSSGMLSSSFLVLLLVSVDLAEENGLRSAFADSCMVWLKHCTRLSSSKKLGSIPSSHVWLSLDVALSPVKDRI